MIKKLFFSLVGLMTAIFLLLSACGKAELNQDESNPVNSDKMAVTSIPDDDSVTRQTFLTISRIQADLPKMKYMR